MSTLDRLATALRSVLDEKQLLMGPAAAPYAVDDVPAGLVALPEEEAQLSDVLRLADEHDATVFPRGGGSHLRLGATPERVDLVVSVERMRRQLAYEPGDMTTTVQAGMPLGDLQDILKAEGQFVALDPPAAAATTIGGIIATNASGPRRLLYGTARDVVLGLGVVGADGARSKAGGRVVKNVTGYDLTKLYIGSLGTLAVVQELTFKVHPLPPGEETIGIACAGRDDLLAVLNALLRLPLRLSSLELLNTAALAALRVAGVELPDTAYLFVARLEGEPAVTAGQTQRVREALRGLTLSVPAEVLEWQPEEQRRVWPALAEQALGPEFVTVKIGLRITDLAPLCADVEAQTGGPTWLLHAHAGNGIVWVQIPVNDGDDQGLVAQMQALDGCVARLNGHRVIERAPVVVKRQCDVWGQAGDSFAVMKALKTTYDPRRRLNPGRFIGGL